MRYSDRNPPGFKDRDNAIVERSRDGTIVNVHRTVPAKDTEHCVEQMVGAYWEVRDDPGVNKLLLIPCFIMDFLCIHPFRDGNGRMSRLLTTLLLYQEGYGVCMYTSMESKINAGRADYYSALERSEKGWFDSACDYTPFISYFLSQLFLCYREYGIMMGTEMGRSRRSNPLKVFLCSCPVPVSKADVLSMFPELSETTVERVLSELRRSGDIRMIGGRRNARYAADGKNLLDEFRIG